MNATSQSNNAAPDLIMHSGLVTTLDRVKPTADAIAIKDGVFTAVGHGRDIMKAGRPLDQGDRPQGQAGPAGAH